ncbi:type I glyceraldehyde-3-phosphate dehydrogenase [Nitrolancea hollandica]|uniref:Glyceraldehyde-3-phosphate dehydrogenase n=1 Tax=Nitrolancea hollandica Lb TaxID=1129897 RepID=I4EEF4_9BACT|nr:type I glyceraldehyde-3-phosphate dehydrogenase [Nitrolancea hollandica]CCF83066.1 Glyceraldehyde-3-phosphate dehydrogenase, type I [Nitrolancea hollandica Lb]
MPVRVGINGFGRIGRQVLKAIVGEYDDTLQVVAVNDLTSPETLAHLLKYDSTYGRYDYEVQVTDSTITVGDQEIRIVSERNPANLPWAELGVDLVIESTGFFTNAADARAHLTAGAKKVIITAPAKNEDITVVLGVNEHQYNPREHHIISNASCTTNCLAPVAKVVQDTFGIRRGLVTTVHSYTNDQVTLDGPHKDLRRARGAAQNIVPTTTGAARALALVIPELKGKFDGFALRVPTPTVSIIDFVAEIEKPTTVDELNATFRAAAEGDLAGILGYTDEPLVSTDFRGESESAVIDSLSTMVMEETMVKVVAWYDNEWGYSCRVADLANMVAEAGIGEAD